MESVKRKNLELDETKTKRFCETTTELTLVELYEDALVEIFSYLDEQDLINVIKVNEIFLSSCRAAFRKKYQHDYIQLPFKKPNTDPDEEDLVDLNRTVQLLRIFGESISKLEFTFDQENTTDERTYYDVFIAIVNNCHQTLIEMKLVYPSTELKIFKCFKMLKTLGIYFGSVGPSMCHFRKWFPMLENLYFDAATKEISMARRIPSLKSFSLEFSEDCEHNGEFHIQEINRLIKRNPQLKEFRLTIEDYYLNTEDSVIRYCFDNDLDANIIPEKMTVKLYQPMDLGTIGYSKALAQLNIPIDRIEHLYITIEDFTKQICGYIAKCVNMNSLKVDISILGPIFEDTAWIDLTKCKLLTELDISLVVRNRNDHSNIVLRTIQPYFDECRNLDVLQVSYRNKFGLPVPSALSYNTLRSQINHNKWLFFYETFPDKVFFTLMKH